MTDDTNEILEPLADLETLEQAQAQRDEYLDLAQRIKAEFENYKRRNAAIRAESYEDGSREVLSAMLPVLDNLERALCADPNQTPIHDGVERVLKQMIDVLEKCGVTTIDRVGEPFDPNIEHAVLQVSGDTPGTVAQVLQKGYRTERRVLRPAMVAVVAEG